MIETFPYVDEGESGVRVNVAVSVIKSSHEERMRWLITK